jgi:hypothetical protein
MPAQTLRPLAALFLVLAVAAEAQTRPVLQGNEFATLGTLNGEFHWSRPANWVEFINGAPVLGSVPVNDPARGIVFGNAVWTLDLRDDGAFPVVTGQFGQLSAVGGDFRLLGDPAATPPTPSLAFGNIYVGYQSPGGSGTRLTFDALAVSSASGGATVVDGRNPFGGVADSGIELSLLNGASLLTSEVTLRDWAFLNLEASRLEVSGSQGPGSLTLDAGNAFDSSLVLTQGSVVEAGPVVLQGVRGAALSLSGFARLDATDLSIDTASDATASVGSQAAVDLRASGSNGSYSGGTFRLAAGPQGSVTFNLEGTLKARVVDLDGKVTFAAAPNSSVRLDPVDVDDTATLDVRNGARLNAGGQLVAGQVRISGNSSRLVVAAETGQITSGSFLQNNGSTTVNGLLRAGSVEFLAGTVGGSGTIEYTGSLTSAVTFGAGLTVQPGNSPGILTINGNLEAAGAIFDIEVAGLDPGTLFDQLAVNGDANLTDATVNFRFIDGFLPTPGDTFDWLVVSGFATGLDTLTVSFFSDLGTVEGFLDGNGRLFVGTVTPIPLPPAAWALGSALLGLGGLARRRRAVHLQTLTTGSRWAPTPAARR